jgi:hypothetical protein
MSSSSIDVNNKDAPSSAKKKRSYKDLPPELRDIGPKDITSVVCAIEIDKVGTKEVLMRR